MSGVTRHRTVPLLALLALAALAACGDAPPDPPPTAPTGSGKWWPPREYAGDPAVQGRVDAEDAIARGRPLRLLHGESDDQRIDAETGLPVGGFGCCYDDANAKYLDAYNAVIDAARAAGRLKEYDFRPKQMTAAAARALLATAGRPFEPGDAPVAAPDGKHRVVLVGGERPADGTLYVERADGSGRYALRATFGALRIAFAADGTTLLVAGGGRPGIETFDLPHAVAVQVVPGTPPTNPLAPEGDAGAPPGERR